MVAHLFSLAFIAVIAYFSVPGSSLFSWHPFMMTLGFFGFMFQAIMVFSKESSLFSTFKHSTKTTVHVLLQTCAILSIWAGFLAIYYHKEEHGKQHFKSWHGLLGSFTVAYSSMQYMAGFLVTQPKLRQLLFMKHLRQFQMNIYHATSGTFLFVLACLSVGLGIYSNWFSNTTPFYIWYMSFALASFLGLIISLQVTSKYVITPKYNNNQTTAATATSTSKKSK